jgi:hypothetical protein
VLDTEATRHALVRLQRSALDPATVAAVARDQTLLPQLRSAACLPLVSGCLTLAWMRRREYV